MNIFKSEVYKLFRKKEVFLFAFIAFACPVLLSVLMGSNSNSMSIQGMEHMGGGFFSLFVYSLLFDLFLIPVIFSTIVVRCWASDFNNGTIAYDITITNSRKKVFIGRVLVCLLVCILYTIMIIVTAILSYKFLGATSEYYTENIMYLVEEKYVHFIITTFLVVLFTCSLSTLFSMSEKPAASTLITIGLFIASRLLEKINPIKEWLPTYLLSASNSLEMNQFDFIKDIIIIVVISGCAYVLSFYIFKRKNIA